MEEVVTIDSYLLHIPFGSLIATSLELTLLFRLKIGSIRNKASREGLKFIHFEFEWSSNSHSCTLHFFSESFHEVTLEKRSIQGIPHAKVESISDTMILEII